jgi:hypothetical protein
MQDNLVRLFAFTEMIDPDDYKSYTESPYRYDATLTDGMILPALTEKRDAVEKISKEEFRQIKNTQIISTDPRIKELKKIWVNADAANFVVETDSIRLKNAPYNIARSDGQSIEVTMSALYREKTFAEVSIMYGEIPVGVTLAKGNDLTLEQLYALINDLQYYLDGIDDIVRTEGSANLGNVTILPLKRLLSIADRIVQIYIP